MACAWATVTPPERRSSSVSNYTPSWAKGAVSTKLQPTAKTPAPVLSDADRISAAREVSIVWSKNPPPLFASYAHDESYYRDFAGENTSHWDAEHWAMFAEMLETPILKSFKYQLGNHYNAATGNYVTKDNVPFMSLADLQSAVKARILELGISEPKLWEWFSVPDPDPASDYGRKIYRESLEIRIKRWQAAAEEVA